MAKLGIGCLVPTDHRDLDPLSGPLCCLTEIIAEVLNEAEKIVPITAADASGHIEAALRLHQPPSRDILVMIAGVALAAAASIDRSAACYFASGAAPGSLIH